MDMQAGGFPPVGAERPATVPGTSAATARSSFSVEEARPPSAAGRNMPHHGAGEATIMPQRPVRSLQAPSMLGQQLAGQAMPLQNLHPHHPSLLHSMGLTTPPYQLPTALANTDFTMSAEASRRLAQFAARGLGMTGSQTAPATDSAHMLLAPSVVNVSSMGLGAGLPNQMRFDHHLMLPTDLRPQLGPAWTTQTCNLPILGMFSSSAAAGMFSSSAAAGMFSSSAATGNTSFFTDNHAAGGMLPLGGMGDGTWGAAVAGNFVGGGGGGAAALRIPSSLDLDHAALARRPITREDEPSLPSSYSTDRRSSRSTDKSDSKRSRGKATSNEDVSMSPGAPSPSNCKRSARDTGHGASPGHGAKRKLRSAAPGGGGGSPSPRRGAAAVPEAKSDREKNRQAQQRFRERQKVMITSLQEEVNLLSIKLAEAVSYICHLERENLKMKAQLEEGGGQPSDRLAPQPPARAPAPGAPDPPPPQREP